MSKTPKPSLQGYTQDDWEEVSDTPELTAEDFKQARPAAEVYPELAAATARRRGRPKSGGAKVAIKIRVAPDVLAAYKATGRGWQTRMNEVLRRGAPTALEAIPKHPEARLAAPGPGGIKTASRLSKSKSTTPPASKKSGTSSKSATPSSRSVRPSVVGSKRKRRQS